MDSGPRRFRRLDRVAVAGVRVPVASRFAARLLGLALLGRRRAGAGLLIPRCRCVHTVGMRFPLDVVFLDDAGREIRRAQAVPSWRVARERGAAAVLELPAAPRSRPGPSWTGTAPATSTTISAGTPAKHRRPNRRGGGNR